MTLPCRLVREHPGCRSHMDSFFDLGRTRWTNQEGSDDRQHTCPMRSEVNSSPSSSKAAGNGRHCAHRATVIHSIDPSKLGCVPSLGRAPMWVTCGRRTRLFSGRVPGAQNQRGWPSNPFIVGALRAQRLKPLPRYPLPLPLSPSK